MMNLKSRSRAIMDYILLRDGYVTLDQVTEHLHVSKRAVYYDLHEIVQWLKSKRIPPLIIERQKGIFLSENQKSLVYQHLDKPSRVVYYTFSQEERIAVMICEMLASTEIWDVDKLANLCNVSRNTTLNDLKDVKNQLLEYKLKLTYGIKKGYIISGETIRMRAVFLYYLALIMPLVNRGILPHFENEVVQHNLEKLITIENELKTAYVEGTLVQLAILIAMIMVKMDRINIGFDRDEITSSKEFSLIQQYFPNLLDEEQIYIAIHLLGARVQFFKPINEEKNIIMQLCRGLPLE